MDPRRTSIALCLVLVGLATFAPGSATAVATDSPAARTVGPTDAAGAIAANDTVDASLGRSIVLVRRGDVATLRLGLEHTDTGTVTIGAPDGNYSVTAVATDGDDDGEVELQFDTAATGTDASELSSTMDADGIRVTVGEPSPDDSLAPGKYPIGVYAGRPGEGNRTDVATLVVAPTGELPETAVTYEGDAVTLHPATGQVLSGTTSLGAGRDVSVRLRSTAGGSPFIVSVEATVDEDGRFAATFDLSDVDPSATATASVLADGELLVGPVPVQIVAEPTETPGQPGFGIGLAAVAVFLTAFARRR